MPSQAQLMRAVPSLSITHPFIFLLFIRSITSQAQLMRAVTVLDSLALKLFSNA